MALDILIVDDERDIRELISGILEDEGFEARTAHDTETALFEVEKRLPSLVIQDIWLQNSKRDGLEVLKILKNRHKNLPIIMISGHGNIETAVASIKLGAYDYIEKPFQIWCTGPPRPSACAAKMKTCAKKPASSRTLPEPRRWWCICAR